MAFVLKDRIKETTNTTGTADFGLAGAVVNCRSFADIGNTNTTFYASLDPVTGAWETGVGTYSTTPTLARTTVISNSLGTTAKISFANSPIVWCDVPASKTVTLDPSGNLLATTQSAGDNSTKVATTAYVDSVFQQKGTWTPLDNSGAGLTFSGVSAGYTKHGNMVHAYWSFSYPVNVSGAASNVSGLPFVVANQDYAPQAVLTYCNNSSARYARLNANASSFLFSDASTNTLANSTFSNDLVVGEAIYPVT